MDRKNKRITIAISPNKAQAKEFKTQIEYNLLAGKFGLVKQKNFNKRCF